MNYYSRIHQTVNTETWLKAQGINLDDSYTLEQLQLYPVEYEYITFDKKYYKMVPDEELVFNEYTKKYIQKFHAESLNEEELKSALESYKQEKRNEFTKTLDENDGKLIRPLANDESKIVAYINEIQAQNRALMGTIDNASSYEEVDAIQPIKVDFTSMNNEPESEGGRED